MGWSRHYCERPAGGFRQEGGRWGAKPLVGEEAEYITAHQPGLLINRGIWNFILTETVASERRHHNIAHTHTASQSFSEYCVPRHCWLLILLLFPIWSVAACVWSGRYDECMTMIWRGHDNDMTMGGESVSSLHAPCVFIFPTPLNPIFRPTPAHVKCYVAPSIYAYYSTAQHSTVSII